MRRWATLLATSIHNIRRHARKQVRPTLQLSSLRSIKNVSTPPLASVSAVQAPDGPPPITATRSFLSSTAPSLMAHTRKPTARSALLVGALHWSSFCPLMLLLKATRILGDWLVDKRAIPRVCEQALDGAATNAVCMLRLLATILGNWTETMTMQKTMYLQLLKQQYP